MKNKSRILTGGVLSIVSLVAFFSEIASSDKIDLFTATSLLFLLTLGIFIIFNNKEDEIEKIK